MSLTLAKSSFAAGEISPAVWGQISLAKYHIGCATLRNCFSGIRGGAYSRAGTKFVGQSRQAASASSTPPRIIPFQFKVGQAYVIEIGDTGGGYARFISNGGYITETPFAITGATQANPCAISAPGHNFNNGDWVFIAGVAGMTQINGVTFLVQNSVPGTSFTLADTLTGIPVNSLAFGAYTGGGTVGRIYTISLPYAASDLPYLKWAQSADVMSLTLNNPVALTEYPPADLARLAANNWTYTVTSFATTIAAPSSCSASPTTTVFTLSTISNQPAAQYAYCVTAVDVNGHESVASPIAYTPNSTTTVSSVDISITAGSEIVTWNAVSKAASYNVYKAPAAIWNTGGFGGATPQNVPIGSSFGLAGSAFGTQFTDQNVVPDTTTTPPLHQNPFARGQILSVGAITATGTFAQATTTATIHTSTGSGAVILPVVVGGTVVAGIIQNAGGGYLTGDTISFADATNGGTGTALLNIGPQSGTYPGVVAYFQQRRVYANTLNNPDTYFMSQPGGFTIMDAADPPIDSDAITGTPWAQQVNGIQALQAMTSGLVALTGLDSWLLTGSGGAGTPITPASQDATSQETNGCAATVLPIKINYEYIFVQELGSIVRSAVFNFFNNTYNSQDLTVLSNHLFDGFQIIQWAWAREPFKIVWAVRNDGILLSLTYLKEQDIIAWARHDTNGQVVSVAVASEPPVDALYVVVQRFIAGKSTYAYYVERMDNRLWQNAEQVWAVDAGLALLPAQPNATLTVSAAGPVNATVVFTASAAIFDGVKTGAPGQVLRMGGGKATVATFLSSQQVTGTITMPITATTPNDPNNLPLPAAPGSWSIGTPVTTVSGLNHLEGMTVTGLADAAVIASTTVTNGTIALPIAASQIVVGLGFQAQCQTLPPEVPGQATIQGKRKKISAVTVRMEKSRGVKIGANQPNASEFENGQGPPWGQAPYGKMHTLKEIQNQIGPGFYIPLFTGDRREPIDDDWNLIGWSCAPGMIAFQQDNPLPMDITACFGEYMVGDSQTKGDPP